MSFVDVTGTVDADTDGIVFEGKPGLERPIIPRFIVPKNLARKISSLTEGDALEIEKQRRSGNTEISFDENKLRSIIESVGGSADSIRSADDENRTGLRSMRMSDEPDNPDFWGSPPDEPPYDGAPEQYDGFFTPDDEQLRDLDRRRGRKPQEEPAPIIGNKYKISKSDDGVYYAENISSEDVFALRSGESKPPKLPFFAPLGGGNDTETGEGYYFSKNGKRYWGKYGAAGALVRRRNADGEYEYFLARRAKGMSVGGGKWSFPGGAHKDRENSRIPGATAIEEFKQEVGGDLSSFKPTYVYRDQVAPDWGYDTYVFEVGPQELDNLESLDGENTDTGWFTASDILQMAEDGKLLESFKRSVEKVLSLSGDESAKQRKDGSISSRVNDEAISSWKSKVRKAKKIKEEDFPNINDQIQEDAGISIAQIMQEEYDDGASIKEIAENWGLDIATVEGLLGGRNAGMSSARRNMQSTGRDEGPASNKFEKVASFVVENTSPLTVIEAYERFSQRRKEKSGLETFINDDFDDGMTVDEIAAKYDLDKKEVLNVLGYRNDDEEGTDRGTGMGSVTKPNKPEQTRGALTALSDDELNSKLDENVNALNELETLLDNGEIDLAEYRKRQVPLRKEAAQLGAEKKRRSGGATPEGDIQAPKREKVLQRGDGMIERDERGNPTKWDGKKFLQEQAEKRRQWILDLGFTPEEADALLGSESDTRTSGMPSKTKTSTKPEFKLTPTNLFVRKVNSRKKGGSPELAEWADREIANALQMYDLKAPREWDNERGSFIPSWFPSRDALVQELNHRGYDVYLGNSGSRRYNDLVFMLNARSNATPEEMRRRIWRPSGLLQQMIRDKEEETGQVFPMKSKIQRWDFGSQIAELSDGELRAMDVEFDNERANKLADVRAGIITKEQFNKWYEGELTPLRRVLSAELTRRRLRAAIDEKRTLDSVFGTGISPKEYAFLSKDPALFTRAAGMLSRRGGSNGVMGEIEKRIASGEITEDDLAFMQLYHDTKDGLEQELIDELTDLFGQHPDDVDWDSLDISVKQQARQIHEEWMRKYSRILSDLGKDTDRTPSELQDMGFDQGEIDDLVSSRPAGMESSKKRRKIKKKWTDEEKRIFSEQKLRSKKIPQKRKPGPAKNEWTERRAGREIKSTTRVSADGTPSRNMTPYYESLANQYFFGLAEYIGEDTRIVNRNFNPNLPISDEPFSTIRISPASMLREGDVLPDGFDSPDTWSLPANPRYKVVYAAKERNGMQVFGLRDAQTGELVVKKLGVNEMLPNVMRPSASKRYAGMTSSRKVNDVKLQSRLTQQFRMEQFDEILKDFEGLISELESIDSQIKILEKNMQKRQQLGISSDGFLETDDKRWTELEDMRSGIEDKIDEYIKFAEFVAEENIQRRRHKAAIAMAKQRIAAEVEKREMPGKRDIFEIPDSGVSELFDFGASTEDVRSLLDEMEISDQDMERVFTAGRPPFTGTKLAKRMDEIVSRTKSTVFGPEFEEFDKDSEDEQAIVSEMAEKIIKSAALEVARNKKIADRSRTIIEAEASDAPSRAALGPGMTSSRTPMGKDLGVSRVIYPTKPNKFIAKDIAFVSYDANRQELSVGYKDKNKYIFGGITPNMVNEIENGDRTLIASLNAIKKDARYTINPNGSTVGTVPNTLDLLNRDKSRLNLSGDDLEIAESVMSDLKNGQDDMTRKMRADRRSEAMGLASGLAKNNEYAMAFNIMDALDEIDKKTKGSGYMPNGMRSYSATKHQRMFVGMSQDEIGEIRDEISAILRKYRNNFFINYGLSKYDENLAGAQKGSGRGQLVLLEPEYNAIMDAYEELAKIDPDWAFVVGPHPVEMAGASRDGRFDTEKFKEAGDFAGKLINNGAPTDMTVSEQRELINWARRQPGFRIVQSIASSYDEKNGTLTANQWRTLRSLHRNYGKGQYRAPGVESRRERTGMRSTSGDDATTPDAISANTMGQFVPYGSPDEDQRARPLTPNADLKGKTIRDAIPEGLSDEEQLALIDEVGQYNPKTNPDGIMGKEFVERRTALLDNIASRRRLEERRAALERAKQSGQIGDDVNLPQHLEFWPLVSEDTKAKLNKASERKYGVQFIDLEPYQMEDILVFETGSAGYYSGGKFKKIKKRPDAIEMEDWERLLLPIHQRVGELDADNKARQEARKLEQQNEPTLEQILEDPNITPERRARIEGILAMKKEAAAKWQASKDSASSARRKESIKDIKLDKYESIDDVGQNGVKNVIAIAKSKYDSDFDSLTDVQKRDVLDTYAREKFGIEHFRNIEQNIQRARSRAERLYQQDRIDGEHIAAWDELAEALEGSGGPTITRKKIDSIRQAIDNYPQESETSTDSEMSLIAKVDDISSLIDEIELAYDDEGITIPSGRSDGMASRSTFKPSGVELKPEQIQNSGVSDDRSTRQTGMSSLFNRGGKDKGGVDEKPEGKPSPAPARKKPIVTDGWKKVGGQGGSNPGGFFEDENGVRYYVKTAPSISHIESEVLAAELYKLLGVGVPEISFGTYKGRPNVISKLIDEPSRPVTGARGDGSKGWQQKVVDGFIADAWLANWDAILNDNVRMDKNGDPIRVDNGGSMKWRARGGPKGADWGDSVGELDSLRAVSPGAPVYRTVTPEQIKQQVKKLESVSPEQIRALVNSIMSDPAEAKELADRLIARRQYIIDRNKRPGGLSSSRRTSTIPEFGSSAFMKEIPKIISNSSNGELMQMWDMTRPFVNLNQYEMSENAKNLNVRIEKIKSDIRDRIKNEVSLRLASPSSRSERLDAGSANGRTESEMARRSRAESIQQALSNRANSIKKLYSSTRMQDDAHTAVWDDLSEALNEDGNLDLTRPKLDSMMDILNSYISDDSKKVTKSGQRTNVRQAEKMRDALAQVSEMYADDPYIDNGTQGPAAKQVRTVGRVSPQPANTPSANQDNNRISQTPTRTTAQYISARKNQTRAQGMTSESRTKEGRAEIRAEATFFKSVQDMLLHEAGKSDDPEVASALRTLNAIMKRQKSGLISETRTNAGAIYLTQKEIDSILDALFMAIDRQTERGGDDRAKLLSDFADIIAKAAMSTFIDKSVPEVNSRTVKKINSEGREVEIPLNE